MGDHSINAQINHLIETTEIDPVKDLSTTRTETGGIMETFLVLHQIKEEASHKIIYIDNQEVINLTILTSADLTIDLRLISRLTNKSFHKTIFKHHLMGFVSPQPTTLILKYQIFAP